MAFSRKSPKMPLFFSRGTDAHTLYNTTINPLSYIPPNTPSNIFIYILFVELFVTFIDTLIDTPLMGMVWLSNPIQRLLLAVEHPVQYLAVGDVHLALVKLYVNVSHRVSTMTQRMGYGLLGNIEACGDSCPGVTCPIGRDLGEQRLVNLLAATSHTLHRTYLLQTEVHPVGVVAVILVAF